jgi:aromatic-amino-acid transaminase
MMMFDRLAQAPGDALHGVMARFRADPRTDKMDLGVGVYRDETGASPVMRAVRDAERMRIERQDTKAYQALAGDLTFIDAMTDLVLGADHPAVRENRVAAIQGAGGTGSLRIALELAKLAAPATRLHVGLPTWPNHLGLAEAAEIELLGHSYFDPNEGRIDLAAIEEAADTAEQGDLFLLHGSCHNPTGADLNGAQRAALLGLLVTQGAVPLIDAAYYGLGGGLAEDLQELRDAARAVPRALISVACSKSFGLYRERTGILFAICANSAERERVQGQLERISRTLVSMPPAHGAATVALILTEPALRAAWEEELAEMRARMLGIRSELALLVNTAPMLRGVDRERGIFKLLPLTSDQIEALARDHAIHMAPSGRANLAGLKAGDAPCFAEALAAVSA